MRKTTQQDNPEVRVDKWLWAARFYKTRRLANDAIQGGKIKLNGIKPKPAKAIKEGMLISIHLGGLERVFRVKALSNKRGPAALAQTLYEETPESMQLLAEFKENLKAGASIIRTDGRPSKKDRRLIHRFKQKNGNCY